MGRGEEREGRNGGGEMGRVKRGGHESLVQFGVERDGVWCSLCVRLCVCVHTYVSGCINLCNCVHL